MRCWSVCTTGSLSADRGGVSEELGPRCPLLQGPLEEQLSEEETHRNGRRLDLFYVSSAHPLTPDIFEMADRLGSLSPAERAREMVPMNPELTREWQSGCVSSVGVSCCWVSEGVRGEWVGSDVLQLLNASISLAPWWVSSAMSDVCDMAEMPLQSSALGYSAILLMSASHCRPVQQGVLHRSSVKSWALWAGRL